MPRYRSHKIVRALKIKDIQTEEPPKFTNAICRGSFTMGTACRSCERCAWEQERGGKPPGSIIVPEDERFAPFNVEAEYRRKHNPRPGGWFVLYEDGYQSFSPAEAFEQGYTLITDETADQEVTNAAFQVLKHAIRRDDSYAWSWHCGIAMAFVDEAGVAHATANRAAARFMQMCFDVDVTKSEQWASLGIPAEADQTTQTPTPNQSLAHRAAGHLGFLLSVIRCGEPLSQAEEAATRTIIDEPPARLGTAVGLMAKAEERRGAAVLFLAAGWNYSNELTADDGLCNDGSCFRCRLVALLAETTKRENLERTAGL